MNALLRSAPMDPSLASVGWPVVDRVFGFAPHGVFIANGFANGAWLFHGKR